MAEKTIGKTRRKLKTAEAKSEAKNSSGKTTVTSNKLELLVTIVGKRKAEYYSDLLQSFDVNLQTIAYGRGTAEAKMLAYLGLADSEKAVIFSVIQDNRVSIAMSVLEDKFKTIKDGKGIAFSIPLTSVIGTLIYRFLSNNRMTVKEDK